MSASRHGGKARALCSTLIVAASLTFSFAGIQPSSAEENGGINLRVPIVAPTPTPSPQIASPIKLPIDTPVAEATLSIALQGLEPFSFIEIFANSTPVLIASGFADAAGRFEAEVQLPPNLSTGDHTISAKNTLSNGTTSTTTLVAFSVTSSGTVGESATVGEDGVATGTAAPTSSSTISEETVAAEQAASLLGPDPFNLGGVFYVGGVTATVDYGAGVGSPQAIVKFAVSNVSRKTQNAQIRFWATTPPGMTVATTNVYNVTEIKPNSIRVVTAHLRDIGQWGLYSAHVSFMPPASVNGDVDVTYNRDVPFTAISLTYFALLFGAAAALAMLTYARKRWGWTLTSFAKRRAHFRVVAMSESIAGEPRIHVATGANSVEP